MATQQPNRADRQPRPAPPYELYKPGNSLPVGKTLSFTAMWFVMGGACAFLVSVAQPNGAQNRTSAAKSDALKATKSAAKPIRVAQNSENAAKPALGPTVDALATSRRPLEFYTQGMRSNLFAAPQPPAPPKPKAVKTKAAPVKVEVPVAPVNPFVDWTYSGTVTMGNQTMALLENTKTKEGQYVGVGQTFMGAQVTAVSDQMVTLSSAGKPTQLAKSDNFTVTPLDKSAAFLTTTPQPGQPGQPGMPGGMPGMGGNMVTLPNGAMIPADAAARRQQFLNRRFNGGGGRRGGRGGGFGGGGFGGGGFNGG